MNACRPQILGLPAIVNAHQCPVARPDRTARCGSGVPQMPAAHSFAAASGQVAIEQEVSQHRTRPHRTQGRVSCSSLVLAEHRGQAHTVVAVRYWAASPKPGDQRQGPVCAAALRPPRWDGVPWLLARSAGFAARSGAPAACLPAGPTPTLQAGRAMPTVTAGIRSPQRYRTIRAEPPIRAPGRPRTIGATT